MRSLLPNGKVFTDALKKVPTSKYVCVVV